MINIKKMEEDLTDTENDDTEDSSGKTERGQRLKPDQNLNKLVLCCLTLFIFTKFFCSNTIYVHCFRLLVLFLKLINNFPFLVPQNIRSEILDIYFDFLTNKNSEIQQLAVTFICKSRALSVYK